MKHHKFFENPSRPIYRRCGNCREVIIDPIITFCNDIMRQSLHEKKDLSENDTHFQNKNNYNSNYHLFKGSATLPFIKIFVCYL